MNDWNVRIRWAGRTPKLWPSVISELKSAEDLTAKNTGLTLTMAVNYGGRQEILDAVNEIAQQVQKGKIKPGSITEKTLASRLYVPEPAQFGQARPSHLKLHRPKPHDHR